MSNKKLPLKGNLRQFGMLFALMVIILFFYLLTGGRLLKPMNVSNLIFQNAYVVILAIGMLLCILTGGNIDLGGAQGSTFTIEISGALGSRELSFASTTAVADIVTAINTFTDVTGVTATASGTGFRIDSTDYGSSNFVSVKVDFVGSEGRAVAT